MMNGNKTIWKKKLFWDISLEELLLFLAFHVLVGFSYWLALCITSDMHEKMVRGRLWLFAGVTAINFGVKLLLIVPVYWLIFRKYRHWHLQKRLLLHLATWPLYIYVWIKIYYLILELHPHGKSFHLTWPFMFWDYFIGSLMYIIQFATLHLYENSVELKKQQQKEKELLQLAHQGEMNALKAQIQPHFLFNTLNSISATVPSHLEHTRELIARLADTFRFALNASANEMIPLRDELAFTRAYLELEKERFHDRLTVHYQIDQGILGMQVPPMLLQPIVENSLKHGIAKSLAGGSIEIAISRRDSFVHFEIADTGAGIDDVSMENVLTKGTGLHNTCQRLQKLYGTTIRLSGNTPRGVRVFFDIPLSS